MSDYLMEYYAGSTEPWAVSVLQAMVRLRHPVNILELGTFEGRTTRAIAEVMPDHATLWTVDIERRHGGFGDPRIKFFEEDAITFLRDICPEKSMNFVFVDDDHTFGHVSTEITMLRDRCMASDGLIVMHDVIGPFGLDKIVEREGGFIIALPLLHAAGGLGVIPAYPRVQKKMPEAVKNRLAAAGWASGDAEDFLG